MFTKRFALDCAERAIKTFAQAFTGALGAGAVVFDGAQWKAAAITAGIATGLSVLTSIASSTQVDSISPASIVPPV